MKQDLLSNNEQIANKTTTKILLIATIAFPALIILGWLKFYEFDMAKLYVYCSIGTIGTVSPYILRKLGINNIVLKYYIITMAAVAIGMLNLNYQIGIHLMFLFPVALSCIYFDKRLTFIALFLQIINVIGTNYFRILSDPLYSENPFGYYVTITSGYIIELFILSMIFIMLAKRTRILLTNLSESEEQSQLFINKLKGII